MKKVFSIITVLALCLSLLCVTALAADNIDWSNESITIDGTVYTNKGDVSTTGLIISDPTIAAGIYKAGSGYATVAVTAPNEENGARGTVAVILHNATVSGGISLTASNYDLTVTGEGDTPSTIGGVGIEVQGGVTINGEIGSISGDTAGILAANGNVAINGTANGDISGAAGYGIYVGNGDVTISGTVKGNITNIWVDNGNVNISGTVTGDIGSSAVIYGIHAAKGENGVTISGSVKSISGSIFGIYANSSDVNISGNANVAVTGGARGICASTSGSVYISGGNVKATGGTCGIWADSSVSISGGTVKATGGESNSKSYGIYGANSVSISGSAEVEATGGVVTATGDESSAYSYGIYAGTNITVSGSAEVEATGGAVTAAAVVHSRGICVNEGNLVISGNSSLTATGGEATSKSNAYSYGIEAFKNITISETAEVYSTGDKATSDEATCSFGICSTIGEVAISGGKVTAKSGEATYSYGIYARNDIVMADPQTIRLPEGGVVASDDTASYIAESDGSTPAKTVEIYTVTAYDICVGGTWVTSDNASDVLGDGTVSYDPDTGILTLNNATVTGSSDDGTFNFGVYSAGDLIIELVGTNTVSSGDATYYSDGFYIDGNLVIQGSGTLTATAGHSPYDSFGIRVMGDLTLQSSGTVTSLGGTVDEGWSGGIYATNLAITGGAIEAVGIDSGFCSFGILSVTLDVNGAVVTAKGGAAQSVSVGIYTYYDIKLTDSTIDATGGADNCSSGVGIYSAYKDIVITDCTVDVAGTLAGILTESGSVEISGAKVTAACNDYGICASGSIKVSCATLEASGEYALLALGEITMDGVTVVVPEDYEISTVEIDEEVYNTLAAIDGEGNSTPAQTVKLASGFAVTFDMGDSKDVQVVPNGDKAVKPADPTKDGYTFEGWYTDEACTTAYDFSTPVTGDLTLYAKWTEASYEVVVPETPDNPQTGDNSHLLLCGFLLLVSAMGVTTACTEQRKRIAMK